MRIGIYFRIISVRPRIFSAIGLPIIFGSHRPRSCSRGAQRQLSIRTRLYSLRKNSLDEGQGFARCGKTHALYQGTTFSRAVNNGLTRALAPEVLLPCPLLSVPQPVYGQLVAFSVDLPIGL